MELTQTETTALEIFTTDGTFEVVYKIAKDRIERSKDAFIRSLNTKKEVPNEEIGAKIRAFDEAMLLVDSVFREIGVHKKIASIEEKNPAR